MGKDSGIQWTDHTFNPWWGCTRVSPGCQHCYAESFAKRTGNAVWGNTAPRRFFGDKYWAQPLKWNRDAEKEGARRRVFCASMADVFEDRPDLVEPRRRLFGLIDDTKNLDWLLLTKRPHNIGNMLREISNGSYPDGWNLYDHMPNVWLGTTVEDQERANLRVPLLLNVPATVRFLSCEPMLGPVDLNKASTVDIINPQGVRSYTRPLMHPMVREAKEREGYSISHGIDWIICGGESGNGARPMEIEWARSLREQCQHSGTPFFMKQLGGVRDKRHDTEDFPEDLRVREFPAPHPKP